MPTVARQWMKKREAAVTINSILDVLEARFGRADEATRRHLMGMKVEDLRSLIRRAAIAPPLDAVLEGGRGH